MKDRTTGRLGALDAALTWLACLALGATLLHPAVPVRRDGPDALLVLDITQSMNTLDAGPGHPPASRLQFAKEALRGALARLPCGSRIGLGIFTEYRSFLLFAPVEVCAHYRELNAALQRIEGRMAWAGGSEIAKGLYSGLAIAGRLPDRPALVFVTDGHEAPPVNPRHRPRFDGRPGSVRGTILGVGSDRPAPIPKFGPDGEPLGFWQADEVLQTDPWSQGRHSSVPGERLVETESGPVPDLGPVGNEHLSSLKEAYLRRLAQETGLAYARLATPQVALEVLTSPALARPLAAELDLRPALGVLALLALAGSYFFASRPARWSTSKPKPPGSTPATGGPP